MLYVNQSSHGDRHLGMGASSPIITRGQSPCEVNKKTGNGSQRLPFFRLVF